MIRLLIIDDHEMVREGLKAMLSAESDFSIVGDAATSASGAPEDPALFSIWRRDSLLKSLPDWKIQLPNENVFNITVRITPGGLGEGVKWATVMPKEMIPRYRPGWPTQQEWVAWTRSFDWLSAAVPFIRAMLDTR